MIQLVLIDRVTCGCVGVLIENPSYVLVYVHTYVYGVCACLYSYVCIGARLLACVYCVCVCMYVCACVYTSVYLRFKMHSYCLSVCVCVCLSQIHLWLGCKDVLC